MNVLAAEKKTTAHRLMDIDHLIVGDPQRDKLWKKFNRTFDKFHATLTPAQKAAFGDLEEAWNALSAQEHKIIYEAAFERGKGKKKK